MYSSKDNKGFTIVELMIATTVFSVILLVISTGIIRIGRMYYKNITSSRVQETARSVLDDFSSAALFSTSALVPVQAPAPSNLRAYCFGSDKYTYELNKQVTGTDHALWHDTTPEGVCSPQNFANGSKELLGENMRLLEFNASADPAGGLTNIKLKVGYGDGDLFTPDLTGIVTPAQIASALCAGGTGSTFCATSTLDTTVKRRVN